MYLISIKAHDSFCSNFLDSKLATDVLKMLVAQPFTAQVYHIANKKQIEQVILEPFM